MKRRIFVLFVTLLVAQSAFWFIIRPELFADSSSATAVCAVPSGSYPNLVNALSDLSCTEVEIGAVTLSERVTISRDLLIRGQGATQTILSGGGTGASMVTISPGATVTIQDLRITDNSALEGGGVNVHAGATLTLNRVTLDNMIGRENGGAIYNSGTLAVNDSQLLTNTSGINFWSTGGGALYNAADAIATLNNTDIINNLSQKDAGAIQNYGTLTINSGTIRDSYSRGDFPSDGNGGAIFQQADATVVIDGTTIISNSALADGAAFHGEGSVTIRNATIDHNQATVTGGAINMLGGTLNISNTSFKHNQGKFAGAIRADNTTGTIAATQLLNNTADLGGAMMAISSNFSMSDIAANHNRATTGGGAIYFLGASAEINGGTFLSNTVDTASGRGGALYLVGTTETLTLTNVTLDHNVGYRGAAIYLDSYSLNGTQLNASNNSATSSGGAIYGADFTLRIDDGNFLHNQSGFDGGAIWANNVSADLIGVDVAHNSANNGGGVYLTSGTGSIDSSSFVSNTATQFGGGIYSTLTLNTNNTTVSNNRANNGGGIYSGQSLAATFNTIAFNSATTNGGGLLSANGNISFGHTILEQNSAANCVLSSGTAASNDYNIDSDASCALAGGNDINSVSAKLQPVAQFSGTYGNDLDGGSPALNSANIGSCPSVDQRGQARPFGFGCDRGAIETNQVHIQFSAASYQAEEGNGTIEAVVTLSAIVGYDIAVDYVTSDGSASAGTDYAASSGTVIVRRGSSSATFTVNLIDNAIRQPDRNFTVVLSSPINGLVGAQSSATMTIIDDDRPRFVFSAESYTAAENVGTTTVVTIQLTDPISVAAQIDYAAVSGSAWAGQDFVQTNGTLNFAVGETSKTITIQILNDDLGEPAESIEILLSNSTAVSIGQPLAYLYITNDSDPTPAYIPMLTTGEPTGIIPTKTD